MSKSHDKKAIADKQAVRNFWNAKSCGEILYLNGDAAEDYARQSEKRYELEPYILDFADFKNSAGKKVLEIGVGLGADHQKFAEAGADLVGIDLTERAISLAKKRLELLGLKSRLIVGDAENLDLPDNSFDIVYSWGVLHHTPNTQKAIEEARRVLKKGGQAKIMIYYKYSIVGIMLWIKYALFALRPWRSLDYIYSHYLESPGTKAYTKKGAFELFKNFKNTTIRIILTHGDLLESNAGQRHRGALLDAAKLLWPRRLIKKFLSEYGLFMLIETTK